MSSWDIIEKGRNDRPAELDPAIRHRAALTICDMAGDATTARPRARSARTGPSAHRGRQAATMNVERALQRRAALLKRLARIEHDGHPGLFAATSGHQTCAQHGDYSAAADRCPVCEGRSTGRTWSVESGGRITRNHADIDPNADDPFVLVSQPYAPELDRCWTGDLA